MLKTSFFAKNAFTLKMLEKSVRETGEAVPSRMPQKPPQMSSDDKFNEIWVQNRFRYRNGMKGSAMRQDEVTGYLEPIHKRGFTAEMKQVYINRFRVCSNQGQIAKSLFVDIQAVYDAIALDKKFREDFKDCLKINKRKKQLNDALEDAKVSIKAQVINDLVKKMADYQ